MKHNWKFNEVFLNSQILICKQELENKKISKRDKIFLYDTISQLESYIKLLHGKNEKCYIGNTNVPLSVLTSRVLKKIIRSSIFIPNEIKDWLIELSQEQSNIFFISKIEENFTYDIDEIVQTSLNVYENSFSNFYVIAEKMVNNEDNLFHFDETYESESSCFYSKYLPNPLFVINPLQGEDCFIHELEHGIEFLKFGHYLEPVYQELGPMVLGRMYADRIYNQGKIQAINCYEGEIKNFKKDLNFLISYLNIFKEIYPQRFLLTSNQLYSCFERYNFFCNDSIRDSFKCFLDYNLLDKFSYVFSFLKSIELKNNIYNNKAGEKRIINCITTRFPNFYNSEKELFDYYNGHLKEIEIKQKKFIKKKK